RLLPSLEERLRESAFRFANTGRNAFSCHQCTGLGSIGELPDIKRVILFGSAARGSPFTLASDIDLAIEGGDSYSAMAIAERSAFHVDVSDLSLLSPRMRERVEAEGWVLHEKKS
ncbi:MAG: nucleotidyltransferase domain-containing protein, partial [Spirochaetota bacterium]